MRRYFQQQLGVFGVWVRAHQRLLVVLVIAACLFPATARAVGLGDILSLFNTITGTIQGEIGGALSGIQLLGADRIKFHQNVLWPLSGITRVKGFVNSTMGRYQTVMWQIQGLRANSATLTNPLQLESLLRSGRSVDINQLQADMPQCTTPLRAKRTPERFSEI